MPWFRLLILFFRLTHHALSIFVYFSENRLCFRRKINRDDSQSHSFHFWIVRAYVCILFAQTQRFLFHNYFHVKQINWFYFISFWYQKKAMSLLSGRVTWLRRVLFFFGALSPSEFILIFFREIFHFNIAFLYIQANLEQNGSTDTTKTFKIAEHVWTMRIAYEPRMEWPCRKQTTPVRSLFIFYLTNCKNACMR